MIKHHVKDEEQRGGMFAKAKQAAMDLRVGPTDSSSQGGARRGLNEHNTAWVGGELARAVRHAGGRMGNASDIGQR